MSIDNRYSKGEAIGKIVSLEVLRKLKTIATDEFPDDHPFHEDLSDYDHNLKALIEEREKEL